MSNFAIKLAGLPPYAVRYRRRFIPETALPAPASTGIDLSVTTQYEKPCTHPQRTPRVNSSASPLFQILCLGPSFCRLSKQLISDEFGENAYD